MSSSSSDITDNSIIPDPQTWAKSRSRTAALKIVRGEHVSARERILAKCGECMGGWIDGRNDCALPTCPLYALQPYRARSEEQPKRPISEASRRALERARQKRVKRSTGGECRAQLSVSGSAENGSVDGVKRPVSKLKRKLKKRVAKKRLSE